MEYLRPVLGLLLIAAVNIGNYKKYTIRQTIATGLLFDPLAQVVRWGVVAVALGAVVFALVTFFVGMSIVREKVPLSWKDFAHCVHSGAHRMRCHADMRGIYLCALHHSIYASKSRRNCISWRFDLCCHHAKDSR